MAADTSETGPQAEDAINRVLAAERDARAAVERAERAAAELVVAARARARWIEDHTDARLSRLRGRCRDWVTRETAARRAEAERVLACPVEDDARRQRLQSAIERLAAQLTGGEDGEKE